MPSGNQGKADNRRKGTVRETTEKLANALKASTPVVPEEQRALQAPHLLKASEK